MDLRECAAIVTGGASGLGEAAVRSLVRAGVECTIVDLDGARGAAVAAELAAEAGELAAFHEADIMDADAMQHAVAATRRFPLRIMVNCAFVPGGQRVIDRSRRPHDLALFRRLIEVNLIGTFNCMRLGAAAIAAAPPLADGERGVIINTASIAAFDGQQGQVAYAAAKAGVDGLTLPAARDLSSHGIRVVTIAPGTFLTPAVAALPDAIREAYREDALAPGRLGVPEEFGDLVVHVCGNSYMNAHTIRLDGGARLRPEPGPHR